MNGCDDNKVIYLNRETHGSLVRGSRPRMDKIKPYSENIRGACKVHCTKQNRNKTKPNETKRNDTNPIKI